MTNSIAGRARCFGVRRMSVFDQVPLPMKSIEQEGEDFLHPFMDNPTIRLDFERFCSDSMVDFVGIQSRVLKKFSSLPLTTNTTGIWTSGLNYYDAFRGLDIVSVDEYPSLRYQELYGCSFSYAFIRGIKGQDAFWVVETSSGGGQGSWARQGVPQPYPGALKQAAIHASASGADLFTYFQYKTFRYGAEQLEAAVLDIDGVERRRNVEFRETAQELKVLSPILDGTSLKNEVAICFDYDCHWAIKIKPFNKGFNYLGYLLNLYGMLKQQGLDADVIEPGEAITRYKVVILPTAVVLSDSFKETLKKYVQNGGIVLSTFLTSIKNTDNTADRVSVPSGLTDLFGLCVGEGDPVYDSMRAQIRIELGDVCLTTDNHDWTESLELQGAQPIGRYETTYRKGEIVAAVNRYGKGFAYYLGTTLNGEAMEGLLSQICRSAGIAPVPFAIEPGTEVITRYEKEKPIYFLFNCREKSAEITIRTPCLNRITNETESGSRLFAPKEYAVMTPLDKA